MNLEVGMYIRTIKGEIHTIHDEEMDIRYRFDCGTDGPFYKDGALYNEITKASHNIIDLVKIGDYVNGNEVIGIEAILGITPRPMRVSIIIGERTRIGKIYIESKDIKSIVTKERFKSMEYEVQQ